MARPDVRRRLIVNADDLGRSPSINAAVIRAHTEGILTTASLMVNEASCAEAVQLAKRHPALGVGLHLSLLCGVAACPAQIIPGLSSNGAFSNDPVWTGLRYFFHRPLRRQIAEEIDTQFARFRETGLKLDHVNGHLHIHLHPVVADVLLQHASRNGIRALRLTCEPFWLNVRHTRGRWGYRVSHAVIYRLLSARVRERLRMTGINSTDAVFGLLQHARVDERYVCRLLPDLPKGDSELYSHPSLDEFKHELEALVSPQVRQLVREQNIELIRYQDL